MCTIMETKEKITYKRYLQYVVPNVFAQLTNVLVRIVELGIVGRFLTPVCVGALGITLTIFNSFDWLLSFLRTSVIGESAQAYEEKDEKAQVEVLTQHVMLILIIGCIFLLMREQIWNVIMFFYRPEEAVQEQSYAYYIVAIRAIPIRFVNCIVMGWFLGRGQGKERIVLGDLFNGIHIILCYIFVKELDRGIVGIALAYYYTQLMMFIVNSIIFLYQERRLLHHMKALIIWLPRNICKKGFNNVDLIIRMGYAVIVSNIVMITSSNFGINILAANTIMMQMKDVMAYIYDGIETTVRGFAIRCKKVNDMEQLKEIQTMALTTIMFVSVGWVVVYQIARVLGIGCILDLEEVRAIIWTYDGWLTLYPILGGWGLGTYGLYVGLMQNKPINYTMTVSFIAFVISYMILVPWIGNHGLWMAFMIFYVVRSLGLLIYESSLYDEK